MIVKYYYIDPSFLLKQKNIFNMISFFTLSILGLLFAPIKVYIKVIFSVAYIFLMLLYYLKIKYLNGLKKHPFKVDEVADKFVYYNEFRGVVEISISKIRKIKTFRRNNNVYLLEIKIKGKQDENVNVEGLSQEDICDILSLLTKINPHIKIEN